jgi:Ca2+-transporting ATPase
MAIMVLLFSYWFGAFIFENTKYLNQFTKRTDPAMSILPEEIPVAFTTFMALGSWRLMKEGVIVKKNQNCRNLECTIICNDKTGTLTQNKMSLQSVYAFNRQTIRKEQWDTKRPKVIIAMWASEPVPLINGKTLQGNTRTTTNDTADSFSWYMNIRLTENRP